jgi:hypothetical protein
MIDQEKKDRENITATSANPAEDSKQTEALPSDDNKSSSKPA